MCYTPYPFCLNRKYRKLPQLNRPLAIIFKTTLCNNNFTEKAKISFLLQVLRLFYKDSLGFRVDAFFKEGLKCDIKKGDFMYLACSATKAILRKLLMRLNYEIDDYKLLKRRKYTLFFIFYISDNSKENKNVLVDITTQGHDTFKFLINCSLYYSKDLMQILFFYYIEEQLVFNHLINKKDTDKIE